MSLTMDEYQQQAARTDTWRQDDGPRAGLHHAVFMLASEAGEVAGLLQKLYQGHELNEVALKLELSDALWAIAKAARVMGWNLSEVAEANLEKLRARYPNGFESERSINRDPAPPDGICGLCGKERLGLGYADGVWLCHPDDRSRQDCYHLWTVYGKRP